MIAILLLIGGVTVTLTETAKVKGVEITVGEIATVSSDNPKEAARVAAASLGYAPAPGYHRILRADLVQFDLQRALPDLQIKIAGVDRCRVDPLTEMLDLEHLWSLGYTVLEAHFRTTDASLKRGQDPQELEVPVGETPLDLRTVLVDRDLNAGVKNVALQLWIDGDLYRTIHLPFLVSLREPRWVLKRSVPEGQIFDPSLFELKNVEIGIDAPLQGVAVEALTGTIAVRPLAASAIVTERDIQRPMVIRRGDLVTVTIRAGGIEAKEIGSALGDARIGESVRVTLQTSKREVSGRAFANGHIEISLR